MVKGKLFDLCFSIVYNIEMFYAATYLFLLSIILAGVWYRFDTRPWYHGEYYKLPWPGRAVFGITVVVLVTYFLVWMPREDELGRIHLIELTFTFLSALPGVVIGHIMSRKHFSSGKKAKQDYIAHLERPLKAEEMREMLAKKSLEMLDTIDPSMVFLTTLQEIDRLTSQKFRARG